MSQSHTGDVHRELIITPKMIIMEMQKEFYSLSIFKGTSVHIYQKQNTETALRPFLIRISPHYGLYEVNIMRLHH